MKLPKNELPRRAGTILTLSVVLLVLIALLVEYQRRETILRGDFDQAPSSPVVSILWLLIVGSAIALLVMLVRRYRRRRRHMTSAERQFYFYARSERPDYLYWPGTPIPERERDRVSDWRVTQVYQRAPRRSSVVIAVALILAMVGVGLTFETIPAFADEGVVVRVVDGDTVDVRVGGKVERVRLLNVDAPEDNRSTGRTECMGPEATDATALLLPRGEPVTLEFDVQRRDRYGRLLAGVTTSTGLLVNAELVRRGVATAAVYGDNRRFADETKRAMQSAESGRLGIFDPATECSPAAQIAALEQAVAPAKEQLPAGSGAFAAVIAESLAVIKMTEAVRTAIIDAQWLSEDARDLMLAKVGLLEERAKQWNADATDGETRALSREKAEAEAAAVAEAQRLELEAAARAAAEAQAEAERRAAEDATINAGPDPDSSGGSDDGSSSGGGGYPSDVGYTGCRNYNGVGMVDSQGRSFEPIPCP